MDSYAIAQAVATLGAAITPPSGYEDIKLSTADLPDAISLFPTLLVMPPVMDDAQYNASRNRSYLITYPCVLFLSRSDGLPRRAKAVHDWYTKVYPMAGGQLQLGLSTYVALATLHDLRGGVMTYAREDYDGLSWGILVRISEAYTPAP